MASEVTFKGVKLVVKKGDIVNEQVDAIVTPANSKGVMGGGVDLAVKKKGGDQIERDAKACAPIFIGRAIPTTAGKLSARLVIHAPTVTEPGFKSEAKNVDRATRAALSVAVDSGVRTISFPGMGSGSGGVPREEAAQTMVSAMRYFLNEREARHPIKEIRLVAKGKEMEKAFDEALLSLSPKSAQDTEGEKDEAEEEPEVVAELEGEAEPLPKAKED